MRTALLAATSVAALFSFVAQAAALPAVRSGDPAAHRSAPPLIRVQAIDSRPSRALSDDELQQRIRTLREFAQAKRNPKGIDVRGLLNSDRAELERRSAAPARAEKKPEQGNAGRKKAVPQIAAEPPKVNRKAVDQAEQSQGGRIQQGLRKKGERKPVERAEDKPPKRQPVVEAVPERKPVERAEDKPAKRQPVVEAAPERKPVVGDATAIAANFVADNRSSQKLENGELRDRINKGEQILRGQGLPQGLQNRLEAMIRADKSELSQRVADAQRGNQGNKSAGNNKVEPRKENASQVEGAARKLANDNRATNKLDERELQRRIGDTRAVLGAKSLPENLRNDLRRRLDRDKEVQRTKIAERERAERRKKVAAADRGKVDDIGLPRNGRVSISDLQRANRRAEDLTEDALQKRITIVRDDFNPNRLSPREREIVDLRLRQDRFALRNRMLQQRLDRRERLNDPAYRITINNTQINNTQINNTVYNSQIVAPVAVLQPAPSIPLAEAYDDQIIGQLVASPVRPIDRPYTISEYRQRPELRDLMPAIELDIVRFGFNEDFLREEEISKLDRIGEVLERIVAGSPDEVFLIEGHTDLVGGYEYNQDLSIRRAAAVRQALTDFYYIGQKNLEIVGYGEQYPLIPVEYEEEENRRVTVRRITPILQGQLR